MSRYTTRHTIAILLFIHIVSIVEAQLACKYIDESVLFWRSVGERRVRISVDEPKAKWAGIWLIQNTENSVATDVFIGFNRTTHRYIETKTQTLQYIGV